VKYSSNRYFRDQLLVEVEKTIEKMDESKQIKRSYSKMLKKLFFDVFKIK